MSILFMCLSIPVLLMLSAFFSGSEIVFASSNKLRIKNAADEGNKRARIAQYILEHFTASISTILLANNLVNITASTVGTLIAAHFIENEQLAQTVATLGVTLLLLIFGEIFPKIFGAELADRLVLAVSRPLRFCMKLFSPITGAVNFVLMKLAFLWTPKEEVPTMTQEELVTMVDEMEESGSFTEEEGELVRAAIEFADLTAKDILTPRVDTLAFDIEDSVETLLDSRELLDFSRFPVYEESLDHIIGILTTQRLLEEYFEKGEEGVDIRSLLTQPVFVHMTRNIASILKEMREKHCEMAVVVDEFGGTLGIITVEDIVEEIVGDIFDETDDVENEFIEHSDGFEVDGSMTIDDFFDLVEYSDSEFESEYTTVGGWAAEMLDKIPETGDRFTFKNLTVTVTKVDAMRVETLFVHVDERDDDEDDEE